MEAQDLHSSPFNYVASIRCLFGINLIKSIERRVRDRRPNEIPKALSGIETKQVSFR